MLKPGFTTMEHPEYLPFWLPNGTQTKQFITYDTAGGNEDGGLDKFQRYIDDNGEWVMFEEYGAGCLYRMQINVFATASAFGLFSIDPTTRIRFYFDHEKTPRIDETVNDFFGKAQKYMKPFDPPLAFMDFQPKLADVPDHERFAVMYYPFPFKTHLKITMTPQKILPAKWYQFTYLKYPASEGVESWKGTSEDSEIVRRQWNNLGKDPKDIGGNIEVNNTHSIHAGTSKAIFGHSGSGSVASLNFLVSPYNREVFTKTNIRIYWDGSESPAVDMSLGSFFGGGGDLIGEEDVTYLTLTNLFYGFDGSQKDYGTFYAYWPMPFWSNAKIVIENNTDTDITFESKVAYKPSDAFEYPKDKTGHFYAKRTISIAPDNFPYSTSFEQTGRGKVVGIMFYSNGFKEDGDEFTYFDDSLTPQIHGDGTEDDHNQGWSGGPYQKALWGALFNGVRGSYRTYYNDSYIFNKSIRITYEHTKLFDVYSGQKTDSVVYYYLDPEGKSNIHLTDELDIGNPESESSHNYTCTGETWSGTTESSYDGYEQAVDYYHVIDTGRAYTGASTFEVNIHPNNEGVKLRKRLNRHFSNRQMAVVYVDGQEVTEHPWYILDLPAPSNQAFIDSDFEIPASYTKGKSKIQIRIEYRYATDSKLGINEYYYWVYSYGTQLE